MSKTNRYTKAYHKGLYAERFATFWLMIKGYRILYRRYRGRAGEIDLVARRWNLVAIIEVKARPTLEECLYALSTQQRRRIALAATQMIAQQPHLQNCQMRFDLIAITPRHLPHHIKDAWRPSL